MYDRRLAAAADPDESGGAGRERAYKSVLQAAASKLSQAAGRAVHRHIATYGMLTTTVRAWVLDAIGPHHLADVWP